MLLKNYNKKKRELEHHALFYRVKGIYTSKPDILFKTPFIMDIGYDSNDGSNIQKICIS